MSGAQAFFTYLFLNTTQPVNNNNAIWNASFFYTAFVSASIQFVSMSSSSISTRSFNTIIRVPPGYIHTSVWAPHCMQ